MSTKYMTSRQLDKEPTDYTTWSHAALQARYRELRAQILRDFPMPATETDEDAHIQRLLQEVKERTTPATPAHPDAPAVDGNELLQEVTQFIARYLHCSEHQRTLLALWVLHTYCFCAARVTPYLVIRSADKQSGKTLCLQLLSLLCDRAALTSGGFTARDLAVPMKEKPIAALLLDECHLTVGTRARPRSPALRAVLAGSFHLGLGHRNIAEERNAFLPKAFASQAALPEELADRCIPIILEPLGAQNLTESATHPDFLPMTRSPDDPMTRSGLTFTTSPTRSRPSATASSAGPKTISICSPTARFFPAPPSRPTSPLASKTSATRSSKSLLSSVAPGSPAPSRPVPSSSTCNPSSNSGPTCNSSPTPATASPTTTGPTASPPRFSRTGRTTSHLATGMPTAL